MNNYYIGNIVTLSAIFRDGDTLSDPTAAVLQVLKPDGTKEDDITPENDGEGLYHHDYTPEESGVYRYRFIGTGAVTAAAEGVFLVLKSPF